MGNTMVFGHATPLSAAEKQAMRNLQLQYIDARRQRWHILESAQMTGHYMSDELRKVHDRIVALDRCRAAVIARLEALGESGTPLTLRTPTNRLLAAPAVTYACPWHTGRELLEELEQSELFYESESIAIGNAFQRRMALMRNAAAAPTSLTTGPP